ncbi:MAG: hypothetical protein OXC99_07870 [Chloroflexi bacterium]|nr:hypothetical protein [Chloroflexota bacterium]
MESTQNLQELQALPGDAYEGDVAAEEILAQLAETDAALHAAEAASETSLSMWPVFTGVNVDDKLQEAYELAYPNQAADHSLHQHWLEMEARGEGSADGFIGGLKGKLGELDAKEFLEERGFQNVELAPDPNQPVWDISAIGENGEQILFQVKTGAASYGAEVVDAMQESPNVQFLVNTEIYNWISTNHPHLLGQVDNFEANISAPFEHIEGIEDGLATLSDNMGIDVPDGAVDLLPYAGAVVAGARLIYSVVSTERKFSDADRSTKNKIQVVQTLTLMSRMGVSVVLAIAGGQAGAAAGGALGSVVPGIGNAVGGIGGGVGGSLMGVGLGMYLNRQLEPHMLDLALDITSLTRDDLFYYKNKRRIDDIGDSIQSTAVALAALPL